MVVQFEMQAIEAHRTHLQEQQSTKELAHNLSEVLISLATRAKDEIGSINDTASSVREKLLLKHESASDFRKLREWSMTGVLWLLEIVLHGRSSLSFIASPDINSPASSVDSTHLQYLQHLPFIRLCGSIVGIAGYLLQACFSIMVG